MDTERPIIIPVYYEEWFAGSSFALVKDIPDGCYRPMITGMDISFGEHMQLKPSINSFTWCNTKYFYDQTIAHMVEWE